MPKLAGRAALRCCPASSHIAAQRALVETAPARYVPHSLYDAVAYRDVLVPPIDSAVLHTGQGDEPVPCGQRHRAFRDWIDRRPTSLAAAGPSRATAPWCWCSGRGLGPSACGGGCRPGRQGASAASPWDELWEGPSATALTNRRFDSCPVHLKAQIPDNTGCRARHKNGHIVGPRRPLSYEPSELAWLRRT